MIAVPAAGRREVVATGGACQKVPTPRLPEAGSRGGVWAGSGSHPAVPAPHPAVFRAGAAPPNRQT